MCAATRFRRTLSRVEGLVMLIGLALFAFEAVATERGPPGVTVIEVEAEK